MSFLHEDNSDLSGKSIEELFYIEKYLNNTITHIKSEMSDFNKKICFLERVLYSKDNDLKKILQEIKYRQDILKKNKSNRADNNNNNNNNDKPYYTKELSGSITTKEEMAIDDFYWR